MKSLSLLRPALWIAIFTLSFAFSVSAQDKDKDWRPISAEDLAAKTPAVEPDADAEALFWEVRIDDSHDEDLSLRHYVRVKIYTERGRDKFSKFDVPFYKGLKIKDISARVTRPDGTSVQINPADIFEREIIKTNGAKIKAKSFAVPNIEPGVIVEYRYREVFSQSQARGMRLAFQRDIPVQKLEYYYKPYSDNKPNTHSYNFSDTKFVKDKNGYWLASRTDVPAFKQEPHMPPDDSVQAWMQLVGTTVGYAGRDGFTLSFTIKDPSNMQAYWGAVSTENAEFTKMMVKGNNDVKKLAADITAGATTHDEKLRKIYDWVQAEIENRTFDPKLTDEMRDKLPVNKSLGDVLKRRSAPSFWIDILFGALASASGLETRVALIGDRSKILMHPQMTNESFIHPGAVAVKVDNQWKLFNPGVKFLPYGMLVWYEEDTWAMLPSEKVYEWKRTPLTSYEKSVAKRDGKFTLLEDGTLEGDVEMHLSGQRALAYRMDNYEEATAKLEADLKAAVKSRISAAEISDVIIENMMDGSKPLVQKYKIRVPGYAEKTGKRLFLQPGFFKHGSSPVFSSSTRKYDILFSYPWSEDDTVEIKLPAGFELDSADSPGDVGDPRKIGGLVVKISIDKPNHTLKYKRNFHFGGGGHVQFGPEMYQPLKGMFDAFNKADTHTITLKQK